MNLVDRKTLQSVAQLNTPTLKNWVSRGLIRTPATITHVLGLAVARRLRQQGVDFSVARTVVEWISALEDAQFRRGLADGEGWLTVDLDSRWCQISKVINVPNSASGRERQFLVINLHDAYRSVSRILAANTSQNALK